MRIKILIVLAVFCLVLLALGVILINECAYGGAMGSAYKACDCLGKEWQLYDQTESDGPRKTLCIGLIRSTTCFSWLEGPEIDCEIPG